MKIEYLTIVKFIVKNTIYTIQYQSNNYEKICVNSLFIHSSLETFQKDNAFMWGH